MARAKDPGKIALIYDSTLSLIMKSGYTDLRIADVAKEAGMATGTLYIYFKNKEELINTLFLQLKEEKIKQMFENTQPTDSFFISFKKLWSAYFTISLKEFPKMLFIEQYAYSSLLTAETKSRSDELVAPLLEILLKAQEEDLIMKIPPEIMMSHIMGATLEIVKYFVNTSTHPSQEIFEQSFQMAWNSIRK